MVNHRWVVDSPTKILSPGALSFFAVSQTCHSELCFSLLLARRHLWANSRVDGVFGMSRCMPCLRTSLICIVWIVYIIYLGTLTSTAYIAAIRENYSPRTPNKLSMIQQIFHRSPTEEAIYGVHCRLHTKPWSTTVAVLFRTLVVYVSILGTDLGTKSRNSQRCLWNMVKFCWAILLRNVLNKYHTIYEALIN